MTVPSTTSRVTYAGDGVSTGFAVNFYFLANADLVVLLVDSDGNSTTQVITTNYTVTGAGVEAGGTVTMLVAPPSGYTLVIYRDPAVTQLTDYQPNDPFPAETHERALDKLTMIAQRAKELVTRSFRLSDADTSGASTELPTPSASKIIGWNATADGLANYNASDFASVLVSGNYTLDKFSGDGVTTAFMLSVVPGSVNNTQANVGGVYQLKKDYSLAGSLVTFNTPPPVGTNNIEVITAGALPIGVPSDGSVTLEKMPDGVFAVTAGALAKFADGFLSATAGARAKMADGFITLAKLATNIFNSATTATIVSTDKLVFSDVSDSGNTKVGLVSDVIALTIADVARHVPVRQTVLSGPVDTNGLAAFGGSTGSTTVTASGTIIATAANGTANRTGSITNPSWTGLSTNGTMYLYLDIAADGTCTTGSTTLLPAYQFGGTYSTTNGQFTYNIQEAVGKVGNGSSATQTYRVFVGQVTVAAGVVSAITWYALNGKYISPVTAYPAAATAVTLNHNIGTPSELFAPVKTTLINAITQAGWAVGDTVELNGVRDGTSAGLSAQPFYQAYDRLSGRAMTANLPEILQKTSSSSSTVIVAADWNFRVHVNRGF